MTVSSEPSRTARAVFVALAGALALSACLNASQNTQVNQLQQEIDELKLHSRRLQVSLPEPRALVDPVERHNIDAEKSEIVDSAPPKHLKRKHRVRRGLSGKGSSGKGKGSKLERATNCDKSSKKSSKKSNYDESS